MGHTVTSVAEGSIADELGIRPGDELLRVNGQRVRDCIDYWLLTSGEDIKLTLSRHGIPRTYTITRELDEPLGLGFDSVLMDKTHTCANRCVFCFVDQQPAGFRPSLTIKDDDWRLSFLMGSFVTLTNVSEKTIERIIAQQISPLYISVHATDPQVRTRLLRNPRAGRMMQLLSRLAQGGIRFHTQVVLCPGLNDGEVLEKTIRDLDCLRPMALSLAVVPVGLTGHRQGLEPIRPVGYEEAQQALSIIHRHQMQSLEKTGQRFVFAADELYLAARHPIPSAPEYEDAGQYENGVGISALLYQELTEALPNVSPRPGRQTLVTGTLAAPMLSDWVAALPEGFPDTRVVACVNHTFGPSVTVAGLLCASDVIAALKGMDLGERVLIPRVMLRDGCGPTLDDWTVESLAGALGVPVVPIENDGMALARALAMQPPDAEGEHHG
nr:DUF512 domain-containing protein [bacterium]